MYNIILISATLFNRRHTDFPHATCAHMPLTFIVPCVYTSNMPPTCHMYTHTTYTLIVFSLYTSNMPHTCHLHTFIVLGLHAHFLPIEWSQFFYLFFTRKIPDELHITIPKEHAPGTKIKQLIDLQLDSSITGCTDDTR